MNERQKDFLTLLAASLWVTLGMSVAIQSEADTIQPMLLTARANSTKPSVCAEPNPDASLLFSMLAQSTTTSAEVQAFFATHLVAQDATNNQCKTFYDVAIDENRVDLFSAIFQQFKSDLSSPELPVSDSIYSYVLANSSPAFLQLLKTTADSAGQQLSLAPLFGKYYITGVTPLMIAAEHNSSSEMVPYLIAQGSALNDATSNGDTALMFSALNSNEGVVAQLIKAGANVNAQDGSGITALMSAATNSQDGNTVRTLISAGATVNTADQSGGVALEYALGTKTPNGVAAQALIDAGATADTADNSGVTALMYAAQNASSATIVKSLIQHGAKVNATADAQTALMVAAGRNTSVEILRALIEAGSAVNAVSSEGGSALEFAVHTNLNGVEIARALIAAGANVNSADHQGRTPLMNAAGPFPDPNAVPSTDPFAPAPPGIYREPLQENIIALLIQSGASLTAMDDAGSTALDYATGAFAPAGIITLLTPPAQKNQ